MSSSNPLILVKSSQVDSQCRSPKLFSSKGFKTWRCLLENLWEGTVSSLALSIYTHCKTGMHSSSKVSLSFHSISFLSEWGAETVVKGGPPWGSVSIQLVSSASEERRTALQKTLVSRVSIQLVSSASEEARHCCRWRRRWRSFHSISFLSEWGVSR